MTNLPLPQWAYVPGGAHEANADYETLAQVELLVPPAFRGYVPARHPALRYGITLNDRGYFWEAREILETALVFLFRVLTNDLPDIGLFQHVQDQSGCYRAALFAIEAKRD